MSGATPAASMVCSTCSALTGALGNGLRHHASVTKENDSNEGGSSAVVRTTIDRKISSTSRGESGRRETSQIRMRDR